MHQFAKQNMESGNVVLPLPNNLQLPLEIVDQLIELDELCNDCGTYSNLVKLLSKVGGSNEVDVTKRIMKRLITTKLACLVNLKGVCGKHGFGKLPLKSMRSAKVLLRTIQRMHLLIKIFKISFDKL